MTTPAPEDKAKARRIMAQLLRVGGGMDPDEADELAEYAVEHAEGG